MSVVSGMGAMRAIGAVPFEATINSKSRDQPQGQLAQLWAPAAR